MGGNSHQIAVVVVLTCSLSAFFCPQWRQNLFKVIFEILFQTISQENPLRNISRHIHLKVHAQKLVD